MRRQQVIKYVLYYFCPQGCSFFKYDFMLPFLRPNPHTKESIKQLNALRYTSILYICYISKAFWQLVLELSRNSLCGKYVIIKC